MPSAKTIARLMATGCDTLSKSETVASAADEDGVPLPVEAREVMTAFDTMIRRKAHGDIDPWLERACASLVASLARSFYSARLKRGVVARVSSSPIRLKR